MHSTIQDNPGRKHQIPSLAMPLRHIIPQITKSYSIKVFLPCKNESPIGLVLTRAK